MKRLFILFVFLCTIVTAQDKRFTAYVQLEPQHYVSTDLWTDSEQTFNIGAGIEWQGTIIYIGAEAMFFNDLRGVDYFHFQGSLLSFNYHFGGCDRNKYRLHTSLIRPGFIVRSGDDGQFTYPMIGMNIGFDVYSDQNIFVGFDVTWDWREDDKYWSPDAEGFSQVSARLRIGVQWKRRR